MARFNSYVKLPEGHPHRKWETDGKPSCFLSWNLEWWYVCLMFKCFKVDCSSVYVFKARCWIQFFCSRERLRRVLRKKAAVILHLHIFTSADLDLHTFTSADLHLHTLIPADLDLHTLTSADLDLHTLTPADLHLHTFTPADLDLHTFTSADLHRHTLTSADLHLHTPWHLQI